MVVFAKMINMNPIIFKNRAQAGKKLAERLSEYKSGKAVILALPRGGVQVAQELSKKLKLTLGIIVVRKIGHPQNPEFSIASISESGEMVPAFDEISNIDQNWLIKESTRQLTEAKRRRRVYWGNREPINIKNKTAILVDDGLATGLTMLAAVKEAKKQNPRELIVAVPVAPKETVRKVRKAGAKVVAIEIPNIFLGAIGSYYEDFPQLTDEEVIEIINN